MHDLRQYHATPSLTSPARERRPILSMLSLNSVVAPGRSRSATAVRMSRSVFVQSETIAGYLSIFLSH